MNTTRWNRSRYGLLAPVYDLAISPLQAAGFRAARRDAFQRLDPQPGDRLLIVGAGTGLDLHHIPPGVDVVATDLAAPMVERTFHRSRRLGMEVDARVMDGETLEFPDESFDHVVLHLILAVMPNPEACAREVARVLKAGGAVSVFDKFVPDGARPSLLRRALNPVVNLAVTDLTRSLGPILEAGDLSVVHREERLLGFFTLALARKDGSA